jgi:hypothetical protein
MALKRLFPFKNPFGSQIITGSFQNDFYSKIKNARRREVPVKRRIPRSMPTEKLRKERPKE